jgi:tRNA(Ile)-lysidine synthase
MRGAGTLDGGAVEPIADDELPLLFDSLKEFSLVILAVSGGADSTALMHLVARWAKRSPGRAPAIRVATIDHGLRAASAGEARRVKAEARALGLEHATLVWQGEKPATAIQEAAREARYGLLVDHARSFRLEPAAIVTAHTEDDQAETFVMRLGRGSGIDGLSGIGRGPSSAGDATCAVVRPFLGVTKARLVATLNARGVGWIEDPSNQSADFERVRVRRALALLDDLGIRSEKIALSARRLARAREALAAATNELAHTALDTHDGAYARIDRPLFAAAPAEIRLRLLTRVLAAFGGAAPPARLAEIERLLGLIEKGSRTAMTLGGCVVKKGDKEINVFREPGRRGLPEIVLQPGREALWDGRFRVAVAPAPRAGMKAGQSVVVRALGTKGYASVRKALSPLAVLPARAGATLPSFWLGEDLVAVPLLPEANAGLAAGAWAAMCTAKFIG